MKRLLKRVILWALTPTADEQKAIVEQFNAIIDNAKRQVHQPILHDHFHDHGPVMKVPLAQLELKHRPCSGLCGKVMMAPVIAQDVFCEDCAPRELKLKHK
jgi:hypothetical protein